LVRVLFGSSGSENLIVDWGRGDIIRGRKTNWAKRYDAD
jgi:hypothetical protein